MSISRAHKPFPCPWGKTSHYYEFAKCSITSPLIYQFENFTPTLSICKTHWRYQLKIQFATLVYLKLKFFAKKKQHSASWRYIMIYNISIEAWLAKSAYLYICMLNFPIHIRTSTHTYTHIYTFTYDMHVHDAILLHTYIHTCINKVHTYIHDTICSCKMEKVLFFHFVYVSQCVLIGCSCDKMVQPHCKNCRPYTAAAEYILFEKFICIDKSFDCTMCAYV